MTAPWLAFAKAAGEALAEKGFERPTNGDLSRALLAGVAAAEAVETHACSMECAGSGSCPDEPPAPALPPPALRIGPAMRADDLRLKLAVQVLAEDYDALRGAAEALHDALRVALEENARLRAKAEAAQREETQAEPESPYGCCPECGPTNTCDEDGLCPSCGATVAEWANMVRWYESVTAKAQPARWTRWRVERRADGLSAIKLIVGEGPVAPVFAEYWGNTEMFVALDRLLAGRESVTLRIEVEDE